MNTLPPRMTSNPGHAQADAPFTTTVKSFPPLHPMRRRANTTTANDSFVRPLSKSAPVSVYSHVSTYRSAKLELQLYSPSLKVYDDGQRPMAVFGDHDQVSGKVNLDPSCYHTGRLSISIEGSFSYQPPINLDEPLSDESFEPHKHVFLSHTTTVSLSNTVEAPSPRSSFRDAFLRKRPSIATINTQSPNSGRSHSFDFYLPQSARLEENLPSTFLSSKHRSAADYFDVTYKVIADWEPADIYETHLHLEVPFLVQPDNGFQSMDAGSLDGDSWLEMPMKPDRPIPVRCAVTLPTSASFSRSSSIPYFVVFTTTPRSPQMAKEIAADATISVSLIRQITITEQPTLPPTPPLTPTSEEADNHVSPRSTLLRRVARSHPRLPRPRRKSEGTTANTREKPLPQLPDSDISLPPIKSYSDTKTIGKNLSVGFPKRPRQHCFDNQKHPSLEMISALPDGLHKTKIPLNKDMLPSIDWASVSVKYYLDVSVLLGHDDFRARIPIRIL